MKHIFRRGVYCLLAMFLIVQVVLNITNQASALATVSGDGILTYGEAASTTPRTRTYATTNSFTAEASAVTGAIPSTITTRTSPTKQEAVSGYVNASGVLQVMCYNGTTWTNEWSVTVGGTGTTNRFDIAYEKTSGDVMVVYSTNTATTNELAYRTKPGSSSCGTAGWTTATNRDAVRTSGIVLWVRLESSIVSASNTIGLAWSDNANDLSATEWTGAAWAIAEPTAVLDADIERVTVAGDVLTFDIAFEGLTGNFMIVWGPSDASVACTAGSNCLKYARYTTAWSAVAAVPTVGDEATNIDIAANPASNEIVVGTIGNRTSTLSTAYWSGSAWTGSLDKDTSSVAPTAGTKLVAVSWLVSGATTRSIVVYADATATATSLSYYTGTAGTYTVGTDFIGAPVPGAFRWLDAAQDPFNKDRLMLTYSDANSDLFAKRLIMTSTPAYTWTNADGSAALETTLTQATNSPFSFAYWRFIPVSGTLSSDIVDAGGSSVASPSLSMTSVAAGNSCQTTTGTLGASIQKIRVTNGTTTPGWTLSIAPTLGATTSWSSGTANYDFNDPSGSPVGCGDGADADLYAGQLSVNPSAGTLTPQSGCGNTGISLGSSSAYSQGVTDSMTLMNASSSTTQPYCYWELTSVGLSQQIPTFQAPGAYTLNMTLTTVAN